MTEAEARRWRERLAELEAETRRRYAAYTRALATQNAALREWHDLKEEDARKTMQVAP